MKIWMIVDIAIIKRWYYIKIDKSNSYDNPDIEVVFLEKDFLFETKFGNCESKFNGTVIVFTLSLAYPEKMEYYLNLTSSIYR